MNNPRSDWHGGSDLGATVWELYERYLVPAIFDPWVHDMLEVACLQGGERVLDVACGTGIVARRALEALSDSGRVVGIDLNANMLGIARASSGGDLIEWHEADASALGFPDSDFDVVLCQQGLQFVPNRGTALSESRRVLRPGGRAIFAVWAPIERSPGFLALADAIERHVSPAVADGLRQGPFGFGAIDALPRDLTVAGFRDVRVEVREKVLHFPSAGDFVRYYVMGSPLASAFAGANQEVLGQVAADVGRALGEVTATDELCFSISAYIAVGWR